MSVSPGRVNRILRPAMDVEFYGYDKEEKKLQQLDLSNVCIVWGHGDEPTEMPQVAMCPNATKASFERRKPLVYDINLQKSTDSPISTLTLYLPGQKPSKSVKGQSICKMDPFFSANIEPNDTFEAIKSGEPLHFVVASSDGQDDVDVAYGLFKCTLKPTPADTEIAHTVDAQIRTELSKSYLTHKEQQNIVFEGQRERIRAIAAAASAITTTPSDTLQIVQVGDKLLAIKPEVLTGKQFTDLAFQVPPDVTGGPRNQTRVQSLKNAEIFIQDIINTAKNSEQNMATTPLEFDGEQFSAVMDEFVKVCPGVFASHLVALTTAAIARRISMHDKSMSMSPQAYVTLLSSPAHDTEPGELYNMIATIAAELCGATSIYCPDGNLDSFDTISCRTPDNKIQMKAIAHTTKAGEHQQLSGIPSWADILFNAQQQAGLYQKRVFSGYSNQPYQKFMSYFPRKLGGDCEDSMASLVNSISMLHHFTPNDISKHVQTALLSAHPDVLVDSEHIIHVLRVLSKFANTQRELAKTDTPRTETLPTLALAMAANQSMQSQVANDLDDNSSVDAMTSFQQMMMGPKSGHACGIRTTLRRDAALTSRVSKVSPGVSVHHMYDTHFLEGTALSTQFTETDPNVICVLKSSNNKINTALQALSMQTMRKSRAICLGNELRSKSLIQQHFEAYAVNFVNTVNDQSCFYQSLINTGGFVLASSDSKLGTSQIFPGKPVTNPSVHALAFKKPITNAEILAIRSMVKSSQHRYPKFSCCNALGIKYFQLHGRETQDSAVVRWAEPTYQHADVKKAMQDTDAVGARVIDPFTTQLFF